MTLPHRKASLCLLAGFAMTAILPAAAQANDGLYMGAEGGINFMPHADAEVNGVNTFNAAFKSGYLLGLNAGYAFDFGLRPEVAVDFRRNDLNYVTTYPAIGAPITGSVNGREQAYTGMFNVWYDLKSKDGFLSFAHPYIGGGIGLASVDLHKIAVPAATTVVDDSQSLLAYQFGTGIGFDFAPNMTYTVDYRYLSTSHGDFNANSALGVSSISTRYRASTIMMGLRYSFAAPPAPVEAAAPPPPVAAAAPMPAPAAAPVDSDGDGVTDDLDKCPNTPPGFKVDATGCIVQQTVVLNTVNFEFNSDQLTPAAQTTLDPIAAALVAQPSLKVEIDGHTDSRGAASYNQKLSERRAMAVRSYLISKGASADGLTARGFGASKPVAGNDTDAGRAQNRRVEFVVTNQ